MRHLTSNAEGEDIVWSTWRHVAVTPSSGDGCNGYGVAIHIEQERVTLAAYLVGTGAGMRCFKDFPEYAGWLFAHVCDLDIVATYPRVSILLNIARETCLMEFCRMQGIGELYRREVGVNLTAGRINATEIMQKILKAPKFDDLLDGFKAELNAQ